MAEPIRIDEWLRALEELQARQVEGFSTADLVVATGLSSKTVQEKLKALVASGRVVYVGTRTGQSINGRVTQIPVYRMVEEAKDVTGRAG